MLLPIHHPFSSCPPHPPHLLHMCNAAINAPPEALTRLPCICVPYLSLLLDFVLSLQIQLAKAQLGAGLVTSGQSKLKSIKKLSGVWLVVQSLYRGVHTTIVHYLYRVDPPVNSCSTIASEAQPSFSFTIYQQSFAADSMGASTLMGRATFPWRNNWLNLHQFIRPNGLS